MFDCGSTDVGTDGHMDVGMDGRTYGWTFFLGLLGHLSGDDIKTESYPEMVGDTSRVTLNFDLSKIPFVCF